MKSPSNWTALAVLASIASAVYVLVQSTTNSAAGIPPGRVHTLNLGDSEDPIRLVLMSDTHVIGPGYVPGTESNPVDNESVLKTPARLRQVRDAVNALLPSLRPDAAVFVGDVVHNALDLSNNYSWFVSHRTALDVASEIFKGFQLPVFFLWGNHDYKTVCRDSSRSVSRPVNHRLLQHFFNSPPYQAVDVGPWRLLLLNSMLGHTWEPHHPDCEPRLASYGAKQLEWIDAQLSDGRPTLVFLHFPVPVSVRDEAPGGSRPDLLSVLSRHSGVVRHVYSGHYHRGVTWDAGMYRFPFSTLPAVRYDEDNFFVLELARDGASHRIADWDKNRGGCRCSDTWTYGPRGSMGPVPGANETGDCGTPPADATATYELPDIQNLSDVPRNFNPERSCWFPFVEPIITTCIKSGATDACCALLVEAFKPSSAAFFASCMCQPAFWHDTQRLFASEGRDAADVIQECSRRPGVLIQYVGQPHGACPTSDGVDGGGTVQPAQVPQPDAR